MVPYFFILFSTIILFSGNHFPVPCIIYQESIIYRSLYGFLSYADAAGKYRYRTISGQKIPIFFKKLHFPTKKHRKPFSLRCSLSFVQCGRWDLNPHKRNAYKILSLARLPVPTLPHRTLSLFFISLALSVDYNTIPQSNCQHIF